MPDDLQTLTARVEQLLTALSLLGEAQRDTIDGLAALREALIVLDTKGDLRAGQAEKIGAVVDRVERALLAIEKPVVAHYDGLRLAAETQDANRGKWATILSPDKIATFVKFAVPIFVALAAGGGLGANFRGCGAILTTANDAPSAIVVSAPPVAPPQPATPEPDTEPTP